MKSGNYDLTKVALVFGMMAFQLHILTMTTSDYLLLDPTFRMNHGNHRNNVIQAFLIIAYLLFILSLLLLLILSYSNLKGNKVMCVFAAFFLFIAASSVVVGVAVFDATVYWDGSQETTITRPFSSYTTTTYVTGAASGYVACVVILASMCV